MERPSEKQTDHEAEAEAQENGDRDAGYKLRQRVGLGIGAVLFLGVLLMPVPGALDPASWYTVGVTLLMATWWITEAIPIPVTALLPVVLFPVLGILPVSETTAPYANPLIFLFLGGFLIARAMQRWNLHRRIALRTIALVGTEPRALIAGFMAASAFLSMWISNTATAMMMLPVGLSIIQLARSGPEASEERTRVFALALMLAIAYACNIGGAGTLIGTPPNALLAGYMLDTYGVDVGFAQWMMLGVPLMLIGLPLAYLLLTRVFLRVEHVELAGGRELVDKKLRQLGSFSRAERLVAVVFGTVALLWMTRPLLAQVVPGLSDAGIAVAGGVVLFLLPVDLRAGTFVLDWTVAKKLPWDVLILFGGGLSLAGAIEGTGLAQSIGESMRGLGGLPILLLLLTLAAAIVALTEVTSNTATAAAFLPILASVAIAIGQNPLLLMVPLALATSCAFMLPVATPPNAIVYGSDYVTIPKMARVGVFVNLLFVLLVTLAAYLLAPVVFGIELGVVPDWAQAL